MLLETLDIKKDDIVIYSQNIFDLDNNFKIIFKDDPEKKIRKIGVYDVWHFVNEYTPKNLIVYRLMTNINDFSLHTSKFGFKVYINEEPEIIYFDPVFAIRELEEYPGTVDENLRFRIQQIGLTTLSRVDNVSNFAEIYSIDLRPHEAKYQKDKVFADAIFALNVEYNSVVKNANKPKSIKVEPDPVIREQTSSVSTAKNDISIIDKDKESSLSTVFKNVRNENQIKESLPSDTGDIKFIKHDIGEDKDFDYKQILKMKFTKKDDLHKPADNFPKLIKHDSENKHAFREFLKTNANPSTDKKEEKNSNHFTDIFKSPEPLIKVVEERQKEKIVLRLNKK